VKNNGAVPATQAIETALRQKAGSKLYFPPGTYILDNLTHPGLLVEGFNGTLVFAPGALIVCTTATSAAQDCVKVQDEIGLGLEGLHISYRGGTLPLPRAHPAPRGMALRFWHATGVNATNIRIDGSTNVGVFVDESRDCKFRSVAVSNTSADGFSSVNSGNIQLTDLTTRTTMDDGLSIIRYAGKANNTGFEGSNIRVFDSAARGITVPGQEDVTISNFAVNNTCAQGVLIATDGSYHTRRPENVKISQGSILGAGFYTHLQNPCMSPTSGGIGLQYADAGDIAVDHVTITMSRAQAVAGGQGPNSPQSGHVVLNDIRVFGENGGGIAIYQTKQLEIYDASINNAHGGFFISNNGDVIAKNLATKNVKGFLNRAFDFEKNNSVEATGIRIVDTQQTPTSNVFVDTRNVHASVYGEVRFAITNGTLKLQTDNAARVSSVADSSLE
jgi:hypothetical protein